MSSWWLAHWLDVGVVVSSSNVIKFLIKICLINFVLLI
jgi:hypothetical protein